MDRSETLRVTLPADMTRMIRDEVEQGHFASSSELVREAIAALQGAKSVPSDRLQAIRAKIAEADSDPRRSLSDDEVERHFAARDRH